MKTYGAINEFRDMAYDRVWETDEGMAGEGLFVTKNGSDDLIESKKQLPERK